jgi:hypothetical protein
MKKSSIHSADTSKADLPALVFPEIDGADIKTVPASLEEIIQMSEEMLPFENKRRKPSEAGGYLPFVLR